MKRIILLFTLCLALYSIHAQTIYTVKYENQADLKVFKVAYENQAVSNEGKWFFVNYENQAKFNKKTSII